MTNDEMMEMIYTPDTVIKRATEEYIENARADEDTYLAMPLDTLAADLTRVVNGEIAKVNEELKYRRDTLMAEKEKAKGDPRQARRAVADCRRAEHQDARLPPTRTCWRRSSCSSTT